MPDALEKKLLGEVHGHKVFQVDGGQVRKNINEEFTNWAAHWDHPGVVPQGEVWIDKGAHPAEIPIFVDRAIKEGRLAQGGHMAPEKVREAGDRYEEAERQKIFGSLVAGKNLAGHPGVREVPVAHDPGSEPSNRVRLVLVDGEQIRNGPDPQHENFTEGGNHGPYKWIPRNEIWLEQGMQPSELGLTALHELHERRQMLGAGASYGHAHRSASIVEHYARENPHLLPAMLRAEIAANDRV